MYSRRDKIEHFDRLKGGEHAADDVKLLEQKMPNHPKLYRLKQFPQRYAHDILYALLDVCSAEDIEKNRQPADGSSNTSGKKPTSGKGSSKASTKKPSSGKKNTSSKASTKKKANSADGSSNTSTDNEANSDGGSSNTPTADTPESKEPPAEEAKKN